MAAIETVRKREGEKEEEEKKQSNNCIVIFWSHLL